MQKRNDGHELACRKALSEKSRLNVCQPLARGPRALHATAHYNPLRHHALTSTSRRKNRCIWLRMHAGGAISPR
eukprot:1276179-Pleurochrysis_carterae.AAC.2